MRLLMTVKKNTTIIWQRLTRAFLDQQDEERNRAELDYIAGELQKDAGQQKLDVTLEEVQ